MKIIACSLIIIAGCWMALNLRAKSGYDQARQNADVAYAITPMDQPAAAFLTEVERLWLCKVDETNGPDAAVVRLAGTTPSVRHLIDVWNYQMPAYQWFAPSQNVRSARIALIKANLMPASLDGQWHLSMDGHLAFLHCTTNVVYLYRDEAGGLRTTLYVRKKNG